MSLSMGKELESQLAEAGSRLLNLPSSVEELLSLLDQVETHLSRVDQSPSESMQTALAPLLNALVANDFLSHSNMDVKVAAACCISEITRITAPNAPCGDDQMKDIFQLIVDTFENLFDMSSRSYPKRVSILETVAKVRSCVVMLDLECDSLILEMFQHFLKAIRDNHPENVFSSMETIMTLVLEESEDISPGLITLLLTCVKKENEDISPIARKLAEKVLENSATKLRPYLMQAVPSLGLSMNDYSQIVATICQEVPVTIDQNNINASEEQMADGEKLLGKNVSDEAPQVVEELKPRTISREHKLVMDVSQTPLMRNGSTENGDDDLQRSPDSSKNKLEQSWHLPQSTKPEPDISVPNTSQGESDKEAIELPEQRKVHDEKANNKISEDELGKEGMASTVHEKGLSSLNVSQSEALRGQSLPDKIHSKRGRKPKKGNIKQDSHSGLPSVEGALSSNQVGNEVLSSADIISKDQPEGKSESEAKPHKRSDEKKGTWDSKCDTPPSVNVVSKKNSGKVSALDENTVKKSGKKSTDEDEVPVDEDESKIKRAVGKTIIKKDVTGESSDKKKVSSIDSVTKSSNKDESYLDETPETSSKRKLMSKTKKTSGQEFEKEFDEKLVGSKIKVWWPLDQKFYGGVIDSFDPIKKTHKVYYFDGDVEKLHLKRERWEIIEDNRIFDDAEASDQASPGSSEMPQAKKVKTDSDYSSKQAKPNASLRRGRGSSTGKGKSKDNVSRSGGNSKGDERFGGGGKSKVEISSKSKAESGGKSEDARPKIKEPKKSVVKLKDESPRSSKSKSETSVSGSKSSANDAILKGKSSASRVQSSEKLAKGEVLVSEKAAESEKKSGKKLVLEKAPENETESGKKLVLEKAAESEIKRGKKLVLGKGAESETKSGNNLILEKAAKSETKRGTKRQKAVNC